MNKKQKPRTDFLKHLAEGDNVKEAAKKVYMSHQSLGRHLSELRKELNARNTVHLIVKAKERGLI